MSRKKTWIKSVGDPIADVRQLFNPNRQVLLTQ